MEKEPTRIVKWIVAVFLLIGGLGMLTATIYSGFQYFKIKSNPATVTATVTKYEEEEDTDADGVSRTEYQLYMTYTYMGEEFTTTYKTTLREAKAKAEIGKKIQIQINPEDPGQSTIQHRDFWLGLLPSVLFLWFGTGLILEKGKA